MAATYSFDITSTIDMQEVDNAINQARKELGQRYDFKGSTAEDRARSEGQHADPVGRGRLQLEALWEILRRAWSAATCR